jgi:hypothetical protein
MWVCTRVLDTYVSAQKHLAMLSMHVAVLFQGFLGQKSLQKNLVA